MRVEKRTVGFAVTGADRVEPLFDGRLNFVNLDMQQTIRWLRLVHFDIVHVGRGISLRSWFLEISGPRLRFLPRLGKSLLHVTLHSASDISPSILIVYSTYDIAQLVHVQIHKLIHRACPVHVEKRTVGFAVTGADRVEPLFDGRLNFVDLHLEHTVGRIGGRHVWRGSLSRRNLIVHSLLLDISGSNVLGRALLFVFPVCG